MPDDHGVGTYLDVFVGYEKSEHVEADDDSECPSSLEYDPEHPIYGTPPNPRATQRQKARFKHAKMAQERVIIAQLDQADQHKKRTPKDTRNRNYDRTHKLQFADMDSTQSTSVPASTNVKVDTHRRIMCLNPKQVIKQDDSLSDSDVQPLLPTGVSSSAPHRDCPSDRYDFYRTFSTLIRLGNAVKKEKEAKAGSNLIGSSPYGRQLSTEQELWQTHLCDLIWFELQAYINVRNNRDQDDFLCEARKEINDTLDRVMSFSAGGIESSKEQLSTNGPSGECVCHKWQSGYSGVCLRQVIQRQCAMSEMVTSLLDDVEHAEALYPTQKALAGEHPVYADEKFQQRIATLCLWMTITRDLAHKIKLMAEIAHISDQSLIGTTWSCLDLRSLQMLVSRYSGKDVTVADNDHSLPGDDGSDKEPEAVHPVTSDISSDCSRDASVSHDLLRQKSVHFEDEHGSRSDAQSRSERRHGRISRPNSTEVTPTSVYRLYVDALLKKTGLRKLLVRLKDLLDTTLQRARLALLPPGYNCQHGISNVSTVIQLPQHFCLHLCYTVLFDYVGNHNINMCCLHLMFSTSLLTRPLLFHHRLNDVVSTIWIYVSCTRWHYAYSTTAYLFQDHISRLMLRLHWYMSTC